jgi:hypothetical protein
MVFPFLGRKKHRPSFTKGDAFKASVQMIVLTGLLPLIGFLPTGEV